MASTFILKRKTYSLEEGKFTGEKMTAGKTYRRQMLLGASLGTVGGGIAGKGKGALIGAGVGAIFGAITAALTRSVFNKKSSFNITTKKLITETSRAIEDLKDFQKSNNSNFINLENYDIDSDPTKFDISVKANEDSIIVYTRPINKEETNILDQLLDEYCSLSKEADYTSEKTKEGGWIITLKLVDYKDAASFIIECMDKLNFRVNFLTK